MSLQVVEICCRIAQLQLCVAYTYFRSTQNHMLLIPEASIIDHHRLQDVFLSHLADVYPLNDGSVQMKDDITVLSAPVSTQLAFFWSFIVMYSQVADMLNTFFRAKCIPNFISFDHTIDPLPH